MKKLSLVNNNIVLIGPMGSGKTSIGRELSKLTNLKFIDIDDEIEKSTGVDIQTIFAHENEEGFRLREANALEKVSSINNSVISTGGGIVINEKNRKIIQSLGLVIYLQTNVENILKRISKDKTRPLIDVEDKKNAIEKIISDRKSYYEEICILKIKTNNLSKNEVVNKILIEYENYKKN